MSTSREEILDYEAFIDLIRSRRSVRRFDERPVSSADLERLIEAARWAPSASNRQQYRFIAVEDPLLLKEMAKAVEEAAWAKAARKGHRASQLVERYLKHLLFFREAPLVLVQLARGGGVDLLESSPGEGPSLEVMSSAAAAVMNLLLCAEVLKLGACWMTGPRVASKEIAALLDFPQGWELSAMIALGHPNEAPDAPRRRPVSRILLDSPSKTTG